MKYVDIIMVVTKEFVFDRSSR